MPAKKPNILVIWGDDIGISNLSCYSHGLMGYKTPNIDRIAQEGARGQMGGNIQGLSAPGPNTFMIDDALKVMGEASAGAK